MAICDYCDREMMMADSCDGDPIEFPDGATYKPIPHDGPDRCGDCNVKAGMYHHPGCDIEECPRCGGQLISCGCLDDEEDDDEGDDWDWREHAAQLMRATG